tara:strand:+ start:751 stop:1524 length:774 start_codon:yes stop_codon:yes gene_type:complete
MGRKISGVDLSIKKIRTVLKPLKCKLKDGLLGIWYLCVKSNRILVIGDSHASVFDQWCMRMRFPKTNFIMGNVQGATVSGLENPNSKTQAKQFFLKMLNEKKYTCVIIQIGEVDTGFVIWYRASKYVVDVQEMYDIAVLNYKKLIEEASLHGTVIVISTPLPTIADDNLWGEVANARKEVRTSQIERTKLTLDFNQEIREFCLNSQVTYISLDNESLGDNGVVKNELKNENSCDHHYSHEKYVNILAPKLKEILNHK